MPTVPHPQDAAVQRDLEQVLAATEERASEGAAALQALRRQVEALEDRLEASTSAAQAAASEVAQQAATDVQVREGCAMTAAMGALRSTQHAHLFGLLRAAARAANCARCLLHAPHIHTARQ